MSIIFIGITLVFVALISVLFDRKKSWDFERRIDEKKQELLEIVSDAEEMVSELNRFSDYVITQVNTKNEELLQNLTKCESKLKEINSKLSGNSNDVITIEKETDIKAVVNNYVTSKNNKPDETQNSFKSDLIIENMNFDKNLNNLPSEQLGSVIDSKYNDKVIPISAKHREVLQLAEKGLTDTEIAKRLNMGKGEIQLILELNR